MGKCYFSFWMILAMTMFSSLRSQDICGTDQHLKYQLAHDPEFKRQYLEAKKILREAALNGSANLVKKNATVYTIPVVVHIFHIGEAIGNGLNISDAQVIGAIQGLNDRFANVIGNSLDVQIQFCLAKQDPNGCPSSGINRVDASILPGYAANGMQSAFNTTCAGPWEYDVLDLSKWPVDNYFNIWVANLCPGPVAFSSGIYGSPYTGVVISPGSMDYNTDILTHETGHSLGLAHTFSGDNNNTVCPTNTNCATDGDYICDTPPHKTYDCSATNPCTPLGNWDYSRYNYMSYCGPSQNVACFTPDQKTAMINNLTLLPCSTLVSSPGCILPGFTPFAFNKKNVSCNSLCDGSVSINPLSLCTPTPAYSYSWSIGGNTNSKTNLCPGIYSVTVTNSLNATTILTISITQPAPLSVSINTTALGCLTNGTANVTGGYPLPSTSLCASGQNVFIIGNGTQLVSATNYPSTYGNSFWSSRHQMVYLASELQAQGMTAGKITALAFNIFAVHSQTIFNNYTIGIKHTNLNVVSVTATGMSSGFQTVFGPQTVTLITQGWKNHTFSTPFVWDGVSNIMIETCFSNGNSIPYQNAQIYLTNTPSLSCISSNDDVLGCGHVSNLWDYARKPNIRLTLCKDTLVYNYNWTNSQNTYTSINLPAGPNFVTVTDGNGCVNTVTFNTVMNLNAGANATVVAGNTLTLGGAPTASGSGPFTYTWSPSVSLTDPNNANPIASPSVATVYTLSVTDANGCVGTTTVSVDMGSDVGFKNYKNIQENMILSPNPAKGLVDLRAPLKFTRICIVNSIGQIVVEQAQLNSDQTVLDLNLIPNGVYFVQITTELGTTIKKLIKE
jgi:hypothetical protein